MKRLPFFLLTTGALLPLSDQVQAQDALPFCGATRVCFVVDDTGSMFGAIGNVKAGLTDLLDTIEEVSDPDGPGGPEPPDFGLCLVTFKDDVEVDVDLATSNRPAVEAAIGGLSATGGGLGPEASDEALNTVINQLPAGVRNDPLGNPGNQTGAFNGLYDGDTNIIVLVTDALPGGFDDIFASGAFPNDEGAADRRAREAAQDGFPNAHGEDLLISAVHVGQLSFPDATEMAIMQNYADVTGGVYVPLPADGSGTATAITEIIETCGAREILVPVDIKPQSCRNPLNRRAGGVLPVAVLGTDSFDVGDIDPETVTLAGVEPLRWSLEDVATPFEPFVGKQDAFDCTTEGPDGFTDLSLKFDNQAVAEAIDGSLSRGDVVVVPLNGETFGGTPIRGEDVVVIVQ